MRLLPIMCLLAMSMACQGTPEYRLGFPAGERQDLGGVRITEFAMQSIEVANTGQQPVILDSVAIENGQGGVLTIDSDTTGCVPGLALRVGEQCRVGVVFEPANDVTYRDSLHVDYRPEDGMDVLRATVGLSGLGVLDCSLRADYTSSYEQGVADADAQIAVDIAEATAAGEALTNEDGYSDGYGSSYDAAYERAYESAYDDGLDEGYDDGYAEGASAEACREGENAGYADGSGAGLVDGEEDGLLEGDAFGYDDGFADGEADACFAEKVDPDASLPGKCVDQGYAATYSRGPYNAAYETAVAANTAYQDGRSLGESEGTRAGQSDGDDDGYADGYEEGADFGFSDGDADEYEACYLGAVDAGYEDGYLSAYELAFALAYDEAYSAGYEDGYEEGALFCF